MSAPVRVTIVNRASGNTLYWVGRLYGYALIVVSLILVSTTVLAGRWIADETPATPDLRTYAQATPQITRMYAADGTLMGEFAKEWREVTPYEQMPPHLVDAFIAIEDHDFWSHGGIYYKGILRAIWANLTAGDFAQGGSTITQQVAKQFLGSEKSLLRKGKEAIMARRLEARYSKRAILSVYLNHIYLGAGAFGVAAAAHRYFQKDLSELTLAEAALIAGLAKAPSYYSPARNRDRALERRNLVLDQMQRHGLASAAEVAAAKAEPLELRLYREVFPDRMPYYAEHVRMSLEKRYGKDILESGGLVIETAVEPSIDEGAYDSVEHGVRKQDKRQGWRGPEWHVDDGPARDLVIQRQRERYGEGPLELGRRYLALVDVVQHEKAEVIVGDRRLALPLRNAKWASKWLPGNSPNDVEITSLRGTLHKGDLIWVARESRSRGKFRDWFLAEAKNPTWRPVEDGATWEAANPDVVVLEQVPYPLGAIYTLDHRTGYVAAMVGGADFARNQRNNTTQACRQPGSTYKPIYYSLGLDSGFGFDTLLTDAPVKIIDPVTGIEWTPTNLYDTIDGRVTLEYAMVYSKNIPSVHVFKQIGAKRVEAWARRLGFTTEIITDDALALGASCTRLDEMTRAFAVFARDGAWWPRPEAGPGVGAGPKDPVYVRRVRDRFGNTLEDNTVAYDAALPAADRLDRVVATAGRVGEQTIPARTAYLTNKLLGQVIRHGFAKTLRNTEIKAAGKTGTSSDTHDTWFVGYTSRFVSTVWMGDEWKKRALGRDDAAYLLVEPLWARYMYEVARGYPNADVPWRLPPGAKKDDRGDHTVGETGVQDLVYRPKDKPPEPAGSQLDI